MIQPGGLGRLGSLTIRLFQIQHREERTTRLRRFIQQLYAVKNVYPPQRLRDCRAPEKFILGHTALGSLDA